jgi:hypothetical protein
VVVAHQLGEGVDIAAIDAVDKADDDGEGGHGLGTHPHRMHD